MGPILAAVLGTAVTEGTSVLGLLVAVAYGAGFTLPFVVLTTGVGRSPRWMELANAHWRGIDAVSVAVLLTLGLILLTNSLGWLDVLPVLHLPPVGPR